MCKERGRRGSAAPPGVLCSRQRPDQTVCRTDQGDILVGPLREENKPTHRGNRPTQGGLGLLRGSEAYLGERRSTKGSHSYFFGKRRLTQRKEGLRMEEKAH